LGGGLDAQAQWEYRVLTIGSWLNFKTDDAEARLKELSADGWEVVNSHRDSLDRMVVVAKRPLTLTERRRRSYP
jgi:hypothetical protein